MGSQLLFLSLEGAGLGLLKGDLDGEFYLELQSRLAKPKVVPPKKKEDALLRKRIEKDKAKDLQARLEQRLSNLKGELASVEAQAEENRQRVLVLQSEWQALYDKTGEDTDVMPENESVHEEGLGERNMGEVDAMDESVGDEGNLDSDDFRTVLSRRERKMQRVNKNDAETEERGPSKEGASSAVLDSIDHNTLCRHTVQIVPTEQFVSAIDKLQRTFLETLAEAANERGLLLADKVTLMLQGQTG